MYGGQSLVGFYVEHAKATAIFVLSLVNPRWHQAGLPYWRLSGFYFFYFAFLGAWIPFWNLYLASELHFSATQIGVVTALMMGSKIVSPYLWGWLADRSGRSLLIIRAGLLLACLSFLQLFVVDRQFLTVALIVAAYSFFWQGVLSQFEVVTLSYLKTAPQRYTLVRVWGSIGFIAAVAGLGCLFDQISIAVLPSLLLMLLLLLWGSSMVVQEPDHHANAMTSATAGQFWQQLKQPAVIAFFACCFLNQFSHGPYYTFYTIYLETLSYSRTHIGLLWSLGVAAEVVLFILMPRLLARYSLRQLFLLTFLLTAIRWLMIAWLAHNPWLLLFAQLFHAASFGSFHAVAIEIVRRRFYHHGRGQGQAFYSMVFGAGGSAGALLSGYLWPLGSTVLFSLAALAAFLAIMIIACCLQDKTLQKV